MQGLSIKKLVLVFLYFLTGMALTLSGLDLLGGLGKVLAIGAAGCFIAGCIIEKNWRARDIAWISFVSLVVFPLMIAKEFGLLKELGLSVLL